MSAENQVIKEPVVVGGGSFTLLVSGATYTCPEKSNDNGGAVDVYGGTVNGTDVSFIGNRVTNQNNGGAIYSEEGIVALSGNVLFSDNTVSQYGGAIYNAATITFGGDVLFSGNTGGMYGGAIYAEGGTITFAKNATFDGNYVDSSGVGGAIISAALINVKGTMTLATAGDDVVNAGTFNLDLTGGTAAYGSVANYQYFTNDGGTLTITVNADQAVGNYVIATGDLTDLTKKNTFTVKTAEDATGVKVTVGNSNVKYGDTIYYSLANVNDTQLVLSVADTSKRIEVTEDNSPYALVTGGTYSCPAYDGYGGAVCVFNGGTVTGSDVTFAGNTATGSGGAISNDGGSMTIAGGATLSGNSATDYGGAIRNNFGTINFTDTVVFDQNTSKTCGAIDNCGGTINFTGSSVSFTGNSAYDDGGYAGAVYNEGTINFGTANVTFSGNTARDGVSGAIDNCDGTINFAGTIDLATESDLWLNEVDEGGTTVNWDLTNGLDQYATIKNFEHYSNDSADVKQTITVTADQAVGDYTIATGNLTDMTNKDTFYLTLDGTTLSDAFKVNTLGYLYNGRYYSLTVDDNGTAEVVTDDKLTLSVADQYEVTTPTGLGGVDTTLAGGTYDRMVLGGELQSGSHDYEGSYTITVTDGEYASDFAGGDAANGNVTRTGSVTVNVSGGTFAKSVTGGNYYAGAKSGEEGAGASSVTGDISLNITGGTFSGRIYGGCGAMTDALGAQSTLDGNVNITIEAKSNAIYIGENIAAGNRGTGKLNGDVNVTITGVGGYLKFDENSVLFGGCSGDYYNVEGGVRTDAVTSVTGTRNLTFDNFEGPFSAEIRMFSDISFVDDTSVDFADEKLDLKEIGVWNFDCSSCVTSLTKNSFTGDTINIDTSNYDGEWTLISGDEAALADLESAASVKLGDEMAKWSNGAWRTSEYMLYVEEEEQLKIAEVELA